MSMEAEIAEHLLKIKAVKLSPMHPFTWASGMLSPIYCDNRVALSHPEVRNAIKRSLAVLSQKFQGFDAIAGVATAGIPHGVLLADALSKPFVYVRSSAKGHGRGNQIEGDMEGIKRVLVVEDLISTGGSVFKAVDALQEQGCEISGVLAIFSYGFEQTQAAFVERNLDWATLSNYNELMTVATRLGYISAQDQATLHRWRDNPQGWGALYA